jgi:nucleoside-diphosphate kinase
VFRVTTIRYADPAMERTFAMIKPDGVKRGLTAEILTRIQRKGYRVSFITSGPVVAIALEGENAILGWRGMMGATNPANAAPGSIRADYATTTGENVSHGSDSPESAERELVLFFKPEELL